MAKSKNNVVTFGLSGKIGDLLVFRQKDGQTIVAKVPQQSGKVSEKQKAHRKRFQQAMIYAKAAVNSPETGDLYKAATKKGQTPINVAVADFFDAPDIEQIDMSGYTGAIGDVIRIDASDDFMVTSVNVKIVNVDGDVEEGEAMQNAGTWWIYTATHENNSVETSKI
ncbi:MAG: hypothetical protein LBD59_03785, partial [Prevotellaceae bacterium]|nr:hypothetical protein [Prevotellaceae bacterium]